MSRDRAVYSSRAEHLLKKSRLRAFCYLAAALLLCASPLLAADEPSLDAAAPGAALGETLEVAPAVATAPAPAPAAAAAPAAGASAKATMEMVLDRAMAQRLISGGVVVVGNHKGIVCTVSKGQLADGEPLTERTIFDVASLTKVAATAPAVMKLIDSGRIALTDTLPKFFPELEHSALQNVTVLNLLTHTSGLNDMHVPAGMPALLRKLAEVRPKGSGFNYADINFILLGELVHRVTGESLDVFCRENLYGPLAAQETLFLPQRNLAGKIAPTLGFTAGVVQDSNARRLGGVAGHAGLFTSAYDLARYARLMLGGGVLDEKRILSEQAVAQMTTPYACGGRGAVRGLGWDIASAYSAPKGSYFSKASFGHTGYSGSSIWIDPQQDLFVILLTNRLDYRNVHQFNNLRRDVSTVAAYFRNSDVQTAKVDGGFVLRPAMLHLAQAHATSAPRHRGSECKTARHGKKRGAVLTARRGISGKYKHTASKKRHAKTRRA